MLEPIEERRNTRLGSQGRAGFQWALVTVLAAMSLANCGESTGVKSETPSGTAEDATRWTAVERLEDLTAASFSHPTEITNEWLPLKPGLRLTYEGSALDDEGNVIHRRMQINVTDLTKVIGGVTSLVSWDLDWADGGLVEAELAFFAQDDAGNVWLMGEYPEEYEDGELVAHPGWMHGIEDANAGIMLPANPVLEMPSFSQGWGPAVGYTDRAMVDSTGVKTCVPVDCYEDVLVVVEGSKEEIDAYQLKYYARGVGNIRVGWRGAGEIEQQQRQLVKVEMLDAKGLAEVRAAALELEKSGYENSPNMYGLSPPLVAGDR